MNLIDKRRSKQQFLFLSSVIHEPFFGLSGSSTLRFHTNDKKDASMISVKRVKHSSQRNRMLRITVT